MGKKNRKKKTKPKWADELKGQRTEVTRVEKEVDGASSRSLVWGVGRGGWGVVGLSSLGQRKPGPALGEALEALVGVVDEHPVLVLGVLLLICGRCSWGQRHKTQGLKAWLLLLWLKQDSWGGVTC